jgi:hypothetical protein
MHQQQTSDTPRSAPLHTRLEAAGYLAISERKPGAVTQQGDLMSVKIDGLVRNLKADLDDFIDSRRQHRTWGLKQSSERGGPRRPPTAASTVRAPRWRRGPPTHREQVPPRT